MGGELGGSQSGRRSDDRSSDGHKKIALDKEYIDHTPEPSDSACVYTNGRDQPTEPSISRSISRFNSTEYSIGNWRARSLIKPLTLKLMAWPSVRPRCCI